MYKDDLQLKFEFEEFIKLLDSTHDGLLLTDLDGQIFYANKAVERICGFSVDDIIGKSHYDLVKEGTIVEESTVVGAEDPITMVHKLITGLEVFITSKPIYDDQNRLIYFIANYRSLESLNALRISHEQLIKKREQTNVNMEVNHKNWIGESKATTQLKEKVAKVAKTEAIILILGNSGVGKEVVANNIHSLSNRRDRPYIQINCAAIPKDLIEAELFGYEKGAFTGANTSKKGLIEAANGGTILLDEIGEMPLEIQTKLLRTIQSQTIFRIGGTKEICLDVRFIAATNKDLKKAVEKGTFREDLYYRLYVIPIYVSPLKKRKEDIVPLTLFFLKKFNQKYNTHKSLSPGSLQFFQDYYWPGNVRQLENIIERLVIMSEKSTITPSDLPSEFKVQMTEYADEVKPLNVVREEAEIRMIQLTLKKYGTIRQAAKHLKVSHSTIIRKLQNNNINFNDYTKN